MASISVFLISLCGFIFFTVAGLCCCARALPSCSEQRLLSSCNVQASHCSGFSHCGAQTLVSRLQQVQHSGSVVVARGLVAPWHVESSRTRGWICVPCIGRQILFHCLACAWISSVCSRFWPPSRRAGRPGGRASQPWPWAPSTGPSCSWTTPQRTRKSVGLYPLRCDLVKSAVLSAFFFFPVWLLALPSFRTSFCVFPGLHPETPLTLSRQHHQYPTPYFLT